MNSLFDLSSTLINESVYPSPEWRDGQAAIRCPTCNRVLPPYMDIDPNAELKGDSDYWPLRGPLVPITRMSWTLIRNDLADALKMVDEGFALHPVNVDGKRLSGYSLYSRSFKARMVDVSPHAL